MHFCADYRQLNVVTRKDAYPIPHTDETLDTLAGSCIFTTLDLLSGYWQVAMHPAGKEKTAVCTQDGLYIWGHCHAFWPQMLMDCVLTGLQWQICLVYLDDVIIFGRSFPEHLNILRVVFDWLREAGLKLKTSKCTFVRRRWSSLVTLCRRRVFLQILQRYKLLPAGLPQLTRSKFNNSSVCAITTVALSRTSLLWPSHFIGWLRRLVSFIGPDQCAQAFRKLKQMLSQAPILAFPDFTKTFVQDTDAINDGIGAVLSQENNGRETVVVYAIYLTASWWHSMGQTMGDATSWYSLLTVP